MRRIISLLLVMLVVASPFALMADSAQGDEVQLSSFVIQDDRGVNVTFDSVPERIVSLGSSFTGTLVDIGAEDQIVGIDEGSESMVDGKTVVGKTKPTTTVIENILNLSADCVICWNFGSYQSAIESLEAAGVKALAFYPSSLDSYLSLIEKLGTLTGNEETTDAVLGATDAMLTEIEEKTSTISEKKTVYFELLSGKAIGGKGFTSDLIAACGLENIYSDIDKSYDLVNPETTVERDPDLIFREVLDNATASERQDTIDEIEDRAGFSAITAVQEGDVFTIDHGHIAMTPSLVLGIQDIAKEAYPELFTDGPVLMSKSPVGEDVSVDAEIDATFSKSMNESSIQVLVGDETAEWTLDDLNITIVPPSVLEKGMEYEVAITGQDVFGNDLENATWTFTTESEPMDLKVFGGIAAIAIVALIILIAVRRR